MAHSLEIADEEVKSQLMQDLSVSRFQNLGKKYFHFDNEAGEKYLKYLTNSTKFLHLPVSDSNDEFFIKIEEGHFYWTINSPVNAFINDFYKEQYKNNKTPDAQSTIRNLYSKWAKAQSAEEKKHLAILIISSLKKFEKTDIYNLLIHSSVLIYQPELFDPFEANDLLEKAFEVSEMNNFEEHNSEIQYLIRLYQGFLNFYDHNLVEANQKFKDALIYKNGVSAIFYRVLTDVIMLGEEAVSTGLQEIIEYDYKRLAFALETNNLSIYNFFLKNNLICNFFNYEQISHLSDNLEYFFEEQKFNCDNKLTGLQKEFAKFRNLRMDDLDLEDFIGPIDFVQKVIQGDQTHKNVLYYCAIDLSVAKFKNTVQSIYDFIVDKNYEGIDDKLKYFDTETKKIKDKLNKLGRDAKSVIEKIKKEAKESVEKLDEKINHNIALLDHKLNNLDMHNNFNPISAFKNSITYSFVISLLIFLVVGMASYSNGSPGESEMRNSVSLFIGAGLKWGAITFLLGFLFAIFSSVSAIMERSTQKQKIVQRIGYVKNEKERQLELINRKRDEDIQSVNDNQSEIEADYQTQIEKLKRDKIDKEAEIKKENDSRIDKEAAPLKPFL